MRQFAIFFTLLFNVAGCSREEEVLLPLRPDKPGIYSMADELFGLPKPIFFRFEQSSTYKAYIDNSYNTDRINTEFYAYNFLNRDLGSLSWHDVPMRFRANHYYGRSDRSDSLLGRNRALSHKSNSLELVSFTRELYSPLPMFFTIEGLTLDFKVDTLKGFTVKWVVDSLLPPDNPLLIYSEFDFMGQPKTFADTLSEWDGQYDYSPLLLTMNQKKSLKLYLARGVSYRDTIGTRTAGFSFIHFGVADLTLK
ncbi:MAG: hypothetical protein ACK4KT_04580 [Thermaurantimonas sp.]